MQILPKEFYTRDPEIVAKELLGKVLLRRLGSHLISGIIVETEAYLAEADEAAHAFKGKTRRNQSLYLDGGHAYVHRIHAYFCLDAVCQSKDIGGSVLIRALEPVEGIEEMRKFRGKNQLKDLTSGPGKLCASLAIDKGLDGADLTNPDSNLNILSGTIEEGSSEIATSSRIGISRAKDHQLRFYIKEHPFVSG